MATANLNVADLDFTSDGTTTIAKINATGSTFTFEGAGAANAAITGITTATATGAISGGTITDGTFTTTAGAVTGATSIATGTLTASGAVRSAVSLILEDPDTPANLVTIAASASTSASYSLTLPVDDGAASEFLQTNGSGVLAWVAMGGGGDVSGPGAVTAANQLAIFTDGSGTVISNRTITLTATDMNFPDSISLIMGTGSDLTLVHDGTDSIITSTTGNLDIINSSATGSTSFRLGTATSATNFIVESVTPADILSINGAGLFNFTGIANGTLSYDFGVGVLRIQDTTAAGAGSGALVCLGGASFAAAVRATSHISTSDVAYKENIEGLTNPLETLMKVEGYSYDLKNKEVSDKRQWGVIAQQLESIGLGHIVEGTEGAKAVNYLALIPLLVEAVKELATIYTEQA